jgi:4'-phosphopantetheinyl transferase
VLSFSPASVAAPAHTPRAQLTPLELSFIAPDHAPDVVLRRLAILLALKSAYIRAIGQPLGFDWSRLEFDVPSERVIGDGAPLTGWEFRLFRAALGVQRSGTKRDEAYQCAVAFFRGTPETRFVWGDDKAELDGWVQFINVDQMVNVIPKMMD